MSRLREESTSVRFVSVVIPERDEEKNIEECLKQLLKQTYPKNCYEIIVVDGMSKDTTRQIVKRFQVQPETSGKNVTPRRIAEPNLMPFIHLIDNPSGQRPAAMNVGIKAATGDVIIRIDAKTLIGPDYIEKCVRTLEESGADNVGGSQQPIVSFSRCHKTSSKQVTMHSLTQLAVAIALGHFFCMGGAAFRLGKKSGLVDTVYLGCFKREVFDKVGLFDEEAPVISEDSEMNFRIRSAGGKVYFNKEIMAYYYPRDTLIDVARLYFRYGGAKAGNFLKHKILAWRQFVPPIVLLTLLLLPLLGIFIRPLFYLWIMVIGTYFMADFIISSHLALTCKISEFLPQSSDVQHPTPDLGLQRAVLFWYLLLIFPTIHSFWALGFWRRLLQMNKPGSYWGY